MVADCFGKDVLSQVSKQEFMKNISMIRETVGDRAILRATYFLMKMNEYIRKRCIDTGLLFRFTESCKGIRRFIV